MKRRVNIGVGLLHKPQLVYMDEPTVGVDPQSRRRILDTVFRMRDEYGMTVLYTTHLMEESQELSDRVAIVDHGKIIAMGTQVELMAQAGEEDRLVLSIEGATNGHLTETLGRVAGVSRAVHEQSEDGGQDTRISVYAKNGRKTLPDVLRAANDAGATVTSVAVKEPDLETLFLNLTGRALRD
jgi:ABC-2 type transport system ATP-binding protein